MTQTLAIFLDAYRDLNSRKLFWVAIAISALAVLVVAALGINEDGFTVFGMQFRSPVINTLFLPRDVFYKLIFQNLGINFWLTWLAAILALISTASLMPDLVSGGAIDMMLSKPITRTRLFLTRWVTGLFFAGIQALVFVTASFLVIGIRGGAWEPSLFIAVPVVIVFFSYLYCVCALLGLLTRSAVASLLLTMVFWLIIYALQRAEYFINMGRIHSDMELVALQSAIDTRLERNTDADVDGLRGQLAEERESNGRWNNAYWPSYAVVTVLPKTSATAEWLERTLVQRASFRPPPKEDDMVSFFASSKVRRADYQQALYDDAEARKSAWWSIGTSVGFEAAILGACVFIFRRRDF